ncbi:MAG: NAD(P)H-binding protein [Candidatus Palauibacterales bacterium]|nr:NAD(P)H-binding protein [Candidatus Palauibacterales bacterium]MDP2584073.1 NAD(P)H-binding protein [Candidatus Palauibacterales bacterium]
MSGGPSSPRSSPSFDVSQAGETATETAEEPLLAAPERSTSVLVVGGSGFLGRHLLPRLLGRGHRVRAVCRRGAPHADRVVPDLEWTPVDITSGSGVDAAVRGCEVVVHLAGGLAPGGEEARRLDLDGTRNLVEAAQRAGVRRIVYVSALGARDANGPFAARKREAERSIRAGRTEHVILRPSLVVGPDDHVVSVLARALRRGPLFVAPGRPDEGVVQPAAVEDVAEALCQAVERADVADATHELAGPDVLSPTEVVGAVARRLSLARRVVRLPRWSGRRLAALADRTGLSAPSALSALRVLALPGAVEGAAALRRVFRLEPLPFAVALDDYL